MDVYTLLIMASYANVLYSSVLQGSFVNWGEKYSFQAIQILSSRYWPLLCLCGIFWIYALCQGICCDLCSEHRGYWTHWPLGNIAVILTEHISVTDIWIMSCGRPNIAWSACCLICYGLMTVYFHTFRQLRYLQQMQPKSQVLSRQGFSTRAWLHRLRWHDADRKGDVGNEM